MCSNMCARPVMPGTSCAEPTLRAVANEKTGASGRSMMMMVRPLSSTLTVVFFSIDARSWADKGNTAMARTTTADHSFDRTAVIDSSCRICAREKADLHRPASRGAAYCTCERGKGLRTNGEFGTRARLLTSVRLRRYPALQPDAEDRVKDRARAPRAPVNGLAGGAESQSQRHGRGHGLGVTGRPPLLLL